MKCYSMGWLFKILININLNFYLYVCAPACYMSAVPKDPLDLASQWVLGPESRSPVIASGTLNH